MVPTAFRQAAVRVAVSPDLGAEPLAVQARADGAQADAYGASDLEGMQQVRAYYNWIVRFFGSHLRGRVLEVGAGIGNCAAHYVSQVEEAVLWEPDARLYGRLAERFSGWENVRAVSASEWELIRADSFDAVVAVNVLEHISSDEGSIMLWSDVLRPGGALLLFVPALPWLYGSLDRAIGHERRYTADNLRRLMTLARLRVVELTYFDMVGVIPWFVAGRIMRMHTLSGSPARIYDRLVVPLSERLEHRVRPPLGKNLICVAIKDPLAVGD